MNTSEIFDWIATKACRLGSLPHTERRGLPGEVPRAFTFPFGFLGALPTMVVLCVTILLPTYPSIAETFVLPDGSICPPRTIKVSADCAGACEAHFYLYHWNNVTSTWTGREEIQDGSYTFQDPDGQDEDCKVTCVCKAAGKDDSTETNIRKFHVLRHQVKVTWISDPVAEHSFDGNTIGVGQSFTSWGEAKVKVELTNFPKCPWNGEEQYQVNYDWYLKIYCPNYFQDNPDAPMSDLMQAQGVVILTKDKPSVEINFAEDEEVLGCNTGSFTSIPWVPNYDQYVPPVTEVEDGQAGLEFELTVNGEDKSSLITKFTVTNP